MAKLTRTKGEMRVPRALKRHEAEAYSMPSPGPAGGTPGVRRGTRS